MESIPQAYVAWRACMTLGFLIKVLQIWALLKNARKIYWVS